MRALTTWVKSAALALGNLPQGELDMQRAIIGTNGDEVVDACAREGFAIPSYTMSLLELHIGSTWSTVAIAAFNEIPTTAFAMACLEYVLNGNLPDGEVIFVAPGPGDKLQRLMPLH